MFARWIGKPGIVGLTSAVMLAAAIAGCGGQPTDSSDVNVVLPAPDVNVSSKASPTAATSPGGATAAAPAAAGTTAAPAATGGCRRAGERSRDRSSSTELRRRPRCFRRRARRQKTPNVCAVDAPIVSERLVVDAATKGVKNVLVYFPRPTAVNEDAKKALAGKTVTFDQKKCIFEPHVLGMMVGETVTLKSSDPVNHNVNVKLKQSTFNQTIAGGQSQSFPLAGAERTPGQVVCDIHPWMSAWWMVLDNPYITVTDEKGNFEIKNVPAGAQKVVVWQEVVKGGGFVTAPSGEEVVRSRRIDQGATTSRNSRSMRAKLLPAS